MSILTNYFIHHALVSKHLVSINQMLVLIVHPVLSDHIFELATACNDEARSEDHVGGEPKLVGVDLFLVGGEVRRQWVLEVAGELEP